MNYPNPFKESTAIRFEKTTDGPLQINIYNLKGQKLRTYSIAALPKGEREIVWDGKDNRGQNCASGLYLIQIQDREGSRIHKAVKLK
jgi:flagellar hook assembly protein FlgD